MKTRPGELGTYNPFTREYEAVLTNEERQEEFQKAHENDGTTPIGIENADSRIGGLADREDQAETFNPRTRRWEKAGYREDK